MSRKQKFSRANRAKHHETGRAIHNFEDTEENSLPPRSKKYPSSKGKLTRIYYNVVFVLFVALVLFLLWYGSSYYPTTTETQ